MRYRKIHYTATLGHHLLVASMLQITKCRVRTVSSKGKLTDGQVNRQEATFLEDIVMFEVHSGARGEEELMSYDSPDGSTLVLSSRAV